MCGIAGVISFGKPINPNTLEAANRRLAHRGPDGDGIYVDRAGRAGLAERRLSIIDLSDAGHQPMVRSLERGEVAIVFNGEIYNYRELKAELDAVAPQLVGGPIPWEGKSDTEVILWAYILWGDEALRLFDGMFALAIWDARTGRLLLARDQFGVKPLYYSLDRERLVFASELKALSALGSIDRTLDPAAIVQYVTFLFTPGERTMFQSVRKLLPGTKLTATMSGASQTVSFLPSFPAVNADLSLTEDSAAQRLRMLLDGAVRRQMVADVPVGAFLSGGLDSSSIVHFARAYNTGGRLKCFTIGHRGMESQSEGWVADLPYAQRVAKHLGVDLSTIWVGPEMAKQFAWMITQLDEPQADPAALNAYFICRLAREEGIKVLLSGAGGDDIFAGYRRHRALAFERWWSWMPSVMRRPLSMAAENVEQGTVWGRRVSKALLYADLSEQERLVGYFRWLPPRRVEALLSRDMMASFRANEPAQPMLDALASLPGKTGPLARMLHLDSRFFLVDHNLNYTDKMSMAASVEVRVPFMDPDLVAFASSLPARFKQHGPVGKWIFRKAMEPFLPQEVIYRPKTGFGVPLRSWLQKELRADVDDALAETTIRKRGIFNPEGVRRLVELDRAGRIDASYSILALMCIEIWCRSFVDAN